MVQVFDVPKSRAGVEAPMYAQGIAKNFPDPQKWHKEGLSLMH